MFHKDTLRLIKKTFKRFLTILLMVLIGVSFMVGLLATKPIMHKSVDIYYDDSDTCRADRPRASGRGDRHHFAC